MPLTKLPFAYAGTMENTPIVFGDRPLLVANFRDDTKSNQDGYKQSMYLYIRDLTTGSEVCRFAEGHSFANAFVDGDQLHVFASEGTDRDWFQSIYHFTTTDLKTWQREPAINKDGDEHLFNCSVCRDDQGFLMAYESNQPVQFCFKFARSSDLSHWEKVPDLIFTGEKREYSACPVIRYLRPLLLRHLPACRHGKTPRLDFVRGALPGPDHLGTESAQSDPHSRRRRRNQQLGRRSVRVGGPHVLVLRDRRSGHVGCGPRGHVRRPDAAVL